MNVISLEGTVDLHIHTAPDVRPRRMDDIELAREAASAGMRAILLKLHHTMTADRAAIASKVVCGIQVFGGLALNASVGGLNPAAVEAALAFGAREIWMPTLSAANHRQATCGLDDGISILDEAGALRSEVFDILNLIAQHDVILGTGHLSVQEIQQLVSAAQAAGVERIVITHPELPIVNMPIAIQKALAGFGVFFERCLIVTVLHEGAIPLSAIALAVRQVGPQTTVLATDFGQVENPSPVEGLRRYIAGMMHLGIGRADIDRMMRINPAWLLGLL